MLLTIYLVLSVLVFITLAISLSKDNTLSLLLKITCTILVIYGVVVGAVVQGLIIKAP